MKLGKLRLSFFLLLCFSCSQTWGQGPEDLEDNPSIQRFRDYLRIPTAHPNPDYGPAIDFLVGQANEIGLSTRTLEFVPKKPFLLMTWKGSSEQKLQSVILNSHMDVVPVEEDKWIYPPFEAHMDEEGKIFARGSQDIKALGMLYLEGLRILKAKGWTPLRDIHVVWAPDEEIGSTDGWERLYNSTEFQELDAAIVWDEGRPTPEGNYVAHPGEKALWWLVINATGESGHGSIYYENSASENMFISLNAINTFRDSQKSPVLSGEKTIAEVVAVNSAYLKSGTPTPDGGFTINVQPSVVEAGFDIRLPPVTGIAKFMDKRIAEEWAPKNRNMAFHFIERSGLTKDNEIPVSIADDSNPWWVLLRTAISKFNATLTPEIAPASTDARFARLLGITAFGIMPIEHVPFLFHADNEFMNGYEFLKGINVTVAIIDQYASFPGPLVSAL
ncbi:hypothetical protein R1sor_023769 [Riccia sorocarpa]|uniref:N-acyl-L-amino-acid amidohydrolase n=1 Tax=Riccia sorocarpa TaxID=122646 RepID=A0ABD3GPD6_9MARC